MAPTRASRRFHVAVDGRNTTACNYRQFMESMYVDLIVSVARMSQYNIINANIGKCRFDYQSRLSISIIGLVGNGDRSPLM